MVIIVAFLKIDDDVFDDWKLMRKLTFDWIIMYLVLMKIVIFRFVFLYITKLKL